MAERRKKGGSVEVGSDASPLSDDYDALKQGTEVQTRMSGKPFDYAFAPAVDYYLKAHLFGDIFARDVDLLRTGDCNCGGFVGNRWRGAAIEGACGWRAADGGY